MYCATRCWMTRQPAITTTTVNSVVNSINGIEMPSIPIE